MKKVSKSFVPASCTYRVGRRVYTTQPAGTKLKYWEVNEQDEYCGVLGYRYNILSILCLTLLAYALYTHLNITNLSSTIIQVADIMYLEDGKLSINANYKYSNGEPVVISIEANNVTVYTGVLKPGTSIGTVECLLKLPTGDTQATVICKSQQDNMQKDEKSVLLKIR